MHKRVKNFCTHIKHLFPHYFSGKNVLDCGSIDINGNNRYLFSASTYTGIDIVSGRNVDFVSPAHLFSPGIEYDVVISTEMLEHDEHYEKSLRNMFALLKPGGLMLLTAAGTGRPEHGTAKAHPGDSPATHDYYKNITVEMLASAIDMEAFEWFEISYDTNDIRFAGIKR